MNSACRLRPEARFRVNLSIAHLVVSVAVVTIFLGNIDSDGLWFSDMPSHALNGVFYKDLIEDGAFSHPRAYAERYYAQYPSLTVGIYPPVFYVVEAALFKLLGISPATAKLAVLFFTLACVNALLAFASNGFLSGYQWVLFYSFFSNRRDCLAKEMLCWKCPLWPCPPLPFIVFIPEQPMATHGHYFSPPCFAR